MIKYESYEIKYIFLFALIYLHVILQASFKKMYKQKLAEREKAYEKQVRKFLPSAYTQLVF